MFAGVPPASGKVEAAEKGNLVVDYHDLLVMRRAHRMAVVEPERQTTVGARVPR